MYLLREHISYVHLVFFFNLVNIYILKLLVILLSIKTPIIIHYNSIIAEKIIMK
jgi:hypothetical protein